MKPQLPTVVKGDWIEKLVMIGKDDVGDSEMKDQEH